VPGHQGLFWFRVRVPGRSAHAGYRTRGVNAIEKAMLVYDALRELETERNRTARTALFAHVDIPAPISVGTLHAGDWPATVPDSAALEGRVGVRLGETVAEAKAEFEAAIQAATDRDPFLREHPPRTEYLGTGDEPAQIALDHPLAQATSQVLGRLKPGFRTWAKTPSTDMRHLVHTGHTPTVIVGPGDDELAHAANESCSIDNAVAAAKFYALLALEWCG
jgi:acetylornithine deacetylase